MVRDQLSDPRTFTAELSPTGFTTSENQNLATVLPKAGGIYSLQVLAKTPGSFAPLISLGTGSTDAEDATPHITINITITCPEPFIQSDGQCVCPAGQESTGGTGADASGCQPCDVGFAKPLPGNELCAPCAEGTYTNLGGQAACTDCLPGSSQPLAGQTFCEQCAVGTSQELAGQAECPDCAPGSVQPREGQARCLPCRGGTAQPRSRQTTCDSCPERLNSTEGAIECELCTNDRYHRDVFEASASTCKSCPRKAGCPFGATRLSTIRVDYGHWRAGNRSRSVEACLVVNGVSPCCGSETGNRSSTGNGTFAGDCSRTDPDLEAVGSSRRLEAVGSASVIDDTSYCRSGHRGPLCQVCVREDQYFKRADGACIDCPTAGHFIALYFSISVGVLLIVLLLRSPSVARRLPILRLRLSQKLKAVHAKPRFKLFISFVQVVVYMGSSFSIPTPALYATAFEVLSLFYVDLFSELFIPIDCIGGWRSLALVKARLHAPFSNTCHAPLLPCITRSVFSI